METVLIFLAGVLSGVLIPVATWLFKPDWLRHRLGLEEPQDHHVGGIQREVLERDPVIGESIRARYERGRELGWHTQHQVPLKVQEGYELFRAPNGARVVHVREDYRGAETLVLLVKP